MSREYSAAGGDRELGIVLDGRTAGRSMREIAADLYGSVRVASDWGSNSVLCARTRRLIRRSQDQAERG